MRRFTGGDRFVASSSEAAAGFFFFYEMVLCIGDSKPCKLIIFGIIVSF